MAIAVFAIVWLILCVQFLGYTPTKAQPEFTPSAFQTTLAALFAGTVGAGTAAFLGIELVKPAARAESSMLKRVLAAITEHRVLLSGVLTYAAVGIIVLILCFLDSAKAPELFEGFAIGWAGWVLGAFSSVFKPA